MSQKDSLKKRIEARLAEAGCDRWSLVAHLLAGGENSNAAFVLMHVIDEMHEAERDTVVVYHGDWRRMYSFGRTRVKTAAKVLAKIGVIYTNHLAQTWRIDEARFWPAFGAALALVCPQLPPTGGDNGGDGEKPPLSTVNTPADEIEKDTLHGLNTPADSEQGKGVHGEQGAALPHGENGGKGVHDEHQIRFDSDTDVKISMLFGALRLKLRGHLEQWLGQLMKMGRELGLETTQTVLARCLAFKAGSWKYIATSLKKAIEERDYGRQIPLIPAMTITPPRRSKGTGQGSSSMSGGSVTGKYGDFFNREDVAAPAPKPAAQPPDSPERRAWATAYQQLELQLDGGKFETFVRGAEFLRFENDAFVIGAINSYSRDHLQHRLYRNVARLLSDAWGKDAHVRFEVMTVPSVPNVSAGTYPPLFQVQMEGAG